VLFQNRKRVYNIPYVSRYGETSVFTREFQACPLKLKEEKLKKESESRQTGAKGCSILHTPRLSTGCSPEKLLTPVTPAGFAGEG
jgi:hypothetical protein